MEGGWCDPVPATGLEHSDGQGQRWLAAENRYHSAFTPNEYLTSEGGKSFSAELEGEGRRSVVDSECEAISWCVVFAQFPHPVMLSEEHVIRGLKELLFSPQRLSWMDQNHLWLLNFKTAGSFFGFLSNH